MVREIEHGSFTPLVFSAGGGMGSAAAVTYKRLDLTHEINSTTNNNINE